MNNPLGTGVVLGHVALVAPDMAHSCAFYEKLGFTRGFEKSDDEGNLILRQLQLGDFFLELFPMPSPVQGAGVEGNHFCLRIASTEEAYRELVARGVTPIAAPVRGASGVSYMFLADPAGNWIELTSP